MIHLIFPSKLISTYIENYANLKNGNKRVFLPFFFFLEEKKKYARFDNHTCGNLVHGFFFGSGLHWFQLQTYKDHRISVFPT